MIFWENMQTQPWCTYCGAKQDNSVFVFDIWSNVNCSFVTVVQKKVVFSICDDLYLAVWFCNGAFTLFHKHAWTSQENRAAVTTQTLHSQKCSSVCFYIHINLSDI